MVMKAHSQVCLAFGYAMIVTQIARSKSLHCIVTIKHVFNTGFPSIAQVQELIEWRNDSTAESWCSKQQSIKQ